MKEQVIVRFPPSPTGLLHIGGVRTALYNWLYARQNGGKFLLRIEDTDKERSKKEFEDNIYDSLKWLGLDWDNKDNVFKQTERADIYKEKLQELIKKDSAYLAEESTQPSHKATAGEISQVVRFRNPGGKIKFQDLIRGEIEMEVGDLNDFIIAKNINEPLYHLTVVVDDLESGVTHIIRGEDHISNTPRQILILEALGGGRPIYAHLPLVLAEDKSKLSKRKHGESVSLDFYRKKGYLPEAILNFVALIGWNPGTDQEIFTLDELIKVFDLAKTQKKGGILNIEKLDWINREHILRQGAEEQFSIFNLEFSKTKWKNHTKVKDMDFMRKFLKIILERIHRWGEVKEVLEAGEFNYLFDEPEWVGVETLKWKQMDTAQVRSSVLGSLEVLESTNNLDEIRKKIEERAKEQGKGETYWPLRTALSGKNKSPDPITLIDILGIEEAKKRLKKISDEIK